MDFIFLVSEAFDGMKKAIYSTLISISTIFACLLLGGVYLVLNDKSEEFIEELKSKISIQAFVENTFENEKIEDLEKQINKVEGIAEVKFLPKEEALKILNEEMNADLEEISGYNPLQDEFTLVLKSEFSDEESVSEIKSELLKIQGIESAEFNFSLVSKIEEFQNNYEKVSLYLGILIAVFAILLITNTIRLSIFARQKNIEIMKLLGATKTFILLPFILEGAFQGFLGACLTSFMIWLSGNYLSETFNISFVVSFEIYFLILAFGLLLGIFGSFVATQKFLKYLD
ncbi:MAG: hypothetical protein DWQ06_06240 [Calditrichaeota bacterium]|nr:MAG: hypothetical protein DWQ06_06240 [Calditrichota bacterium]